MKLSLVLAFLAAGCAGSDPTAETEEDLSGHTYACTLAHHSADALSIRVSKTKTKVTAFDANELSADLAPGSTFVLDPNYSPRSVSLAGRSEYVWDQSNTRLIMEQSLRTGGTIGYLTIEGGHVSRERADLVCRR
jgi:hypothetical protein